ncbi:MAG TPA: type II toxin-antitoxin system RelE/ParE family toxin [Candidatus Paceibacterota bacterium]
MTEPGNKAGVIVRYHPAVISKDIPALDRTAQKRIRLAINNKLLVNPLLYGKPLHGTLRRFFKLRIGNWRIVYEITPSYVDILLIAHRKDSYSKALNRIGK